LELFQWVDEKLSYWRGLLDLVVSVFVTFNFFRLLGNPLFQGSPANELLAAFDTIGLHILANSLRITDTIVHFSESFQNVGETAVFFLHLLMVAPALLSFPSLNEFFHGLENLVHSPHMFVKEVLTVDLKEPVISLILLVIPMTSLETLG